MKSLRNKISAATQAGFTLIELVIVIVIIGILAAVAIPQFSNLTDDANLGKAQGIAGAVNSAYSTGLATCSGGLASCPSSPKDQTTFKAAYNTCDKARDLLEGGATANTLPSKTAFTAAVPPQCAVVSTT